MQREFSCRRVQFKLPLSHLLSPSALSARATAMPSFLYAIFHPLRTLNLWLENDPKASVLEVLYLLTVFSAFGIWLVFDRYQKAHNSAVPFRHNAPEVSCLPSFFATCLTPSSQAADPQWESLRIHNASLTSHLTEPDLLPHHFMGGRDYITSYDPANSLHIKTVIADNEREIQGKIQRAKHAQVSWAETTFAQRRRVMRSLLKWLVENQEACARVACRDTGKTCKPSTLQAGTKR